MEKVNTKLLQKIEKGDVKLEKHQKIETQNNWDSSQTFTLTEERENWLSTITLERKNGEITSIEKRIVAGDRRENIIASLPGKVYKLL